jgi:hypothetical protein
VLQWDEEHISYNFDVRKSHIIATQLNPSCASRLHDLLLAHAVG